MMLSKTGWCGIVLLCLGIASGVIQALFYGDLDENGYVRDSFFLPLSFILGGAGAFLLLFTLLKRGMSRKE